jgi:hypothetical protein
LKCEQGDMAKIIFSLRPENIGKVVIVSEYIGKFKPGEQFDFKGLACMCPVHDHYWWINAPHGLSNLYGGTEQAYIADSWLEPIRPDSKPEETEERIDTLDKVAA